MLTMRLWVVNSQETSLSSSCLCILSTFVSMTICCKQKYFNLKMFLCVLLFRLPSKSIQVALCPSPVSPRVVGASASTTTSKTPSARWWRTPEMTESLHPVRETLALLNGQGRLGRALWSPG